MNRISFASLIYKHEKKTIWNWTGEKSDYCLFGGPWVGAKADGDGVLEGEEITVEQIAPLGDPISVMVAGYQVSLRISEADSIIVDEN